MDVLGKDPRYAGESVSCVVFLVQQYSFLFDSLNEMIQHMWDQEKVHLATFDKLLPK